MVREPQDGSLGDALSGIVGRAAAGAVAGAVLLLGLGLLAELLRRRHRALRLLSLLDLTIPTSVRAVVISVLALFASLSGPRPVSADEGVRGWLNQTGVSTTSTRAPVAPTGPVATPGAISSHDPATTTTTPAGPVVLIPPLVIERDDPAPVESPATPSPPISPTVPSTPAPPGTEPSGPIAGGPTYVVQRGDCLWSIASHLLGPHATGASIDRGWRQIYAANRAAIGDDPNLIHIGLTLALPPLVAQP